MTDFHPLKYTAALEKIINDKKPNIIACAHTYQARDWIPRLSARLNIPFVSDCIDVKKDGENIIITRQMYQGKINADISSKGPLILSLQSGSFRADEIEFGNGNAEAIAINISNEDTIRPLDKFKEIVRYLNGLIFGSEKTPKSKKKRGRPKGSKNKSRVKKSFISSEVKKALKLIKRNRKTVVKQ